MTARTTTRSSWSSAARSSAPSTSTAACCASSVASASNDHRLGANEAPPAIISIFLGEQLADVFDQIAKGGATRSKEKGTLTIGVDTLPNLTKDPGDRNRTSPFAFTGNRFEFRAPGSGQTVAGPMVMLNTIMAEALDYCATELETAVAAGTDFNEAVQSLLAEIIGDHGKVIFNGNGYSEEWPIEAEQRGLKNLRTTVDALPELITPEAIELFAKYNVFSEREMHSRYEIGIEQYVLTVVRRGQPDPGDRHAPRSCRRRSATRPSWPQNVAALKAAGVEADTEHPRGGLGRRSPRCVPGSPVSRPRSTGCTTTRASRRRPTAATACSPRWLAVRGAADTLEGLVADDLWALPTYQEMLYIL